MPYYVTDFDLGFTKLARAELQFPDSPGGRRLAQWWQHAPREARQDVAHYAEKLAGRDRLYRACSMYHAPAAVQMGVLEKAAAPDAPWDMDDEDEPEGDLLSVEFDDDDDDDFLRNLTIGSLDPDEFEDMDF